MRPSATLKVGWPSVSCGVAGVGLLFTFQIYQAAFGLKPAALVGLALGVMLVSLPISITSLAGRAS